MLFQGDYYRQLQLFKSILPLLPLQNKEQLLVFITFQEMRYLLVMLKDEREKIARIPNKPFNMSDLMEQVKQHCTKEEAEQLGQLMDLFELLSLMKDLNDMPPMQDGETDTPPERNTENEQPFDPFAGQSGSGDSPMNMLMPLLSEMMSPSQQTLFQQFQNPK